MLSSEKIKEFTDMVCRQIRWKKAHSSVSREMEDHIIDQRDAYIQDGAEEADATDKAIAQMGDPVAVGMQLDGVYRPKPQWGMLLLTGSLVALGVLIQVFLSKDNSLSIAPSSAVRHGVFAAVGLLFLVITYFADFTFIGRHPKAVYFSVLALSAVIFASSELRNGQAYYATTCSLLFPAAYSGIVYSMRGKGYRGILLCGLAFLPPAVFTVLVPSMTGLLLFAVGGLVLLSIAMAKGWFGVNKRHGFLPVALFAVGGLIWFLFYLSREPYRWERFQTAFHPELDPLGGSYMAVTTKLLLANARFLGTGPLPEPYTSSPRFPIPPAHTDYLLTTVIFKMGWLVFGVILAILVIFLVMGFRSCWKQKSGLGLLVSVSVWLTFTFQVINYVVYNLGFQLAAPLSLPLISHGSAALVINLALAGLMLSVFRCGDIVKDGTVLPVSGSHFITWEDGKLIIDFGKRS